MTSPTASELFAAMVAERRWRYRPARGDELEFEVALEGIEGRITFEIEGVFGSPKLRLDGQAPRRVLLKKNVYRLPKVDGGEATVRVIPAWNRTLPTLEIDGQKVLNGQAIPVILMVATCLPLVLLVFGGWIGGALGGGSVVVSYYIARSDRGLGRKVTLILGVGAAVVVSYFVIALGIMFLGQLHR